MYQALYRKWRPRVFADVVGQEHITTTLKNEVKNGKIGHAYLFTGLRGTGKTTCAKILSRAVNCLHPVEGDPCNSCENCQGIASGRVMDVTEIDAASNSGVDNIRDIRDEAVYTPTNVKKRVYIIDEAHMLSTGAWNALLKILEEPPAHVVFILATTESQKIPATILSRCQRFDFRRIPLTDIADRLRRIAGAEGVGCEEGALRTIARLADGSMRDSLSILDQCIGVSDHITMADVIAVTGLVSADYLGDLSYAIGKRDFAAALGVLSSLYENAKNFALLCDELITHYRNLLLVKCLRNPADFLSVGEEETALLHRSAALYSRQRILTCMDILQQALEVMYRNANQRVQLEMSVLKMCDETLENSLSAIVSRLERLESGSFVSPAASVGAHPADTASTPAPAAQDELSSALASPNGKTRIGKAGVCPDIDINDLPFEADLAALTPPPVEPQTGGSTAPASAARQTPPKPSPDTAPAKPTASRAAASSDPDSGWQQVVARLREAKKRALVAHLSMAKVAVQKNKILIYVDNDMAKTVLSMPDGAKAIAAAVRQVYGDAYHHEVVNAGDAPPQQPAVSDAFRQLLQTSEQLSDIVEIEEDGE